MAVHVVDNTTINGPNYTTTRDATLGDRGAAPVVAIRRVYAGGALESETLAVLTRE